MELNEQNNKPLTKKERKELRRQERAKEEQSHQNSNKVKKWTKRFAVILVIAGAIGRLFWYGATRPTVPTSELLTVASDDWVKGNKEGTVTLVEYLDFECEACGAYYPVVKRLSEEYKDRVKFVVRYFPLPGHQNSMTSASAVEAAGKQGKYWEMHDIVFENQRDWGEKQNATPEIFEGYAKQLGLNFTKFQQDVTSQEVKNRIERDKNTGTKLGIQGTPTFFLNGKKIENPRGYEEFKKMLDDALKINN